MAQELPSMEHIRNSRLIQDINSKSIQKNLRILCEMRGGHMNNKKKKRKNMMAFWTQAVIREKTKKKRNDKGFSLIELIIVIAIMAILAAAIAPALIRYIDKSRKAVDIANAEVIFKAAEMACTTGSDDAQDGWAFVANRKSNDVAYTEVTENGYNVLFDKTTNKKYHVACIAWARGVNYNYGGTEWQNALFKCTLDNNNKLAMQYTDEFLSCLLHDSAKGETYKANQKLKFNGFSEQSIEFRFKKKLVYGQPECWMLCINCENYTPEVWIGDKNFNGRGTGQLVRPLYRIYPNPCDAYRN